MTRWESHCGASFFWKKQNRISHLIFKFYEYIITFRIQKIMQIGMCHDLFDFLLIQYDAGMPECRNRRAVTVEGFIAGQRFFTHRP